MYIYITLGLVVVAVVLFVIISLQSAEFRVTRSTHVNAPAELVFAQVNDLHNWEVWSPWAKLDPNAKNTYEGSPSGIGAAFAWSGNNKVGEGRMVITESRPYELVRFQLDFLRPMRATNIAEFTFKSEGSQSKVTWLMTGHKNFFAKAFGLIIDCEKMVGPDFEKGLAQMKNVVESGNRPVAVRN